MRKIDNLQYMRLKELIQIDESWMMADDGRNIVPKLRSDNWQIFLELHSKKMGKKINEVYVGYGEGIRSSLSPSSGIFTKENMFCQHFDVCYQDIYCIARVATFRVEWFPLSSREKFSNIVLVGQKTIFSENVKTELWPLYDKFNNIIGTHIQIAEDWIELRSQFECSTQFISNLMTTSYRKYSKNGRLEALILDISLSGKLTTN